MSLSAYKKKRNFSDTPEPVGKQKSAKDSLLFVIQKHDASHLHYDLRLEMRGVLKSWAIPKGPSLNPDDKRLSMLVEDHPYDYRTFEGIIPEGNYGAGTVIVWDEGTYEPMNVDGLSKEEQEKLLLKQLHTGDLKITFHGKKIKGSYALFQLKKSPEGKPWLLVKKKDKYVKEEDVTKKDKSVVSGKTLVQVAKANGTEVKHPEGNDKNEKVTKRTSPSKRTPASKVKKEKKSKGGKSINIEKMLADSFTLVKKASIPGTIKPMLSSLADEPFDSADWLFEIKWDGYRAVAYIEENSARIISRNNLSFSDKYYLVTQALQQLNFSAVIDGEIAAVNEQGFAEFQLLQNWQNSEEGKLQYYAFDLLWLDGYDLTMLPLVERKRILKEIIPGNNETIKYSDHVVENGNDFFNAAMDMGLEGIMAKKADSTYQIGNRSNNWLKIKVTKRQEVVICGFTEPRNTRQYFGALLLGVYEDKQLIYVGHTGSGFNQKTLKEVWNKLQPLITDKNPFSKKPKTNMPATWVKPGLVCEIKFTEWTKEKVARHPIFMGLREDKDPKEVHIETSKSVSENKEDSSPEIKAKQRESSTERKSSKVAKPKTKAGSKKTENKIETSGLQLSLDDGKEQIVEIDKHELKLTNLDKLYWKKEKCLKLDVINHYLRMAPYILPYMKDRPQSLNRHPNGIDAKNFFQKDMAGKVPDWMQLHDNFSESTNETVSYLVCKNEATLIYMANLGCIEMNPWHSRTEKPLNPDYCLIDLDPQDIGFDKIIECAHVVKEVLDAIGADAYCKTSGSRGLHIYIPLGAQYNYEQSKQLAELVVTLVHHQIPEYTSLERSPAKRKNKIYLDYLQNREIQTVAAPYSLRPKPGVPVSTPLYWEEVKNGLSPTTYNINNILDRVKAEGDLFAPVLGKGIDLKKVLEKIESL